MIKKACLIGILLMSYSNFAVNCTTIEDCIKYASQVTNKKYLSNINYKKDKFELTGVEINKDNIDFYLSYMLNTNGYTRVYNRELDLYTINYARDVRYSPLPTYENISELPKTYDYASVLIKLDHISPKKVVRSIRPFMSRYGRIMPLENNKVVLMQDTAVNIIRLNKHIKNLDKPTPTLSKEEKRKQREERKFNRKLRLLKAKNCSLERAMPHLERRKK